MGIGNRNMARSHEHSYVNQNVLINATGTRSRNSQELLLVGSVVMSCLILKLLASVVKILKSQTHSCKD